MVNDETRATFSTEVNQNSRDLLARVSFPRLTPVKCICFEFDWFIALIASVVIDHSNYLGFGFTTLNETLPD